MSIFNSKKIKNVILALKQQQNTENKDILTSFKDWNIY